MGNPSRTLFRITYGSRAHLTVQVTILNISMPDRQWAKNFYYAIQKSNYYQLLNLTCVSTFSMTEALLAIRNKFLLKCE